MNNNHISRIASFSVDHDFIIPGIYISRIDGDITTYDLRTRIPNADDYMDNVTMHSFEHMFATFIRNSEISENVIYFGPMGCQTGFYLLIRDTARDTVYNVIIKTLQKIKDYDGEMFGAARKECGNYKNLDIKTAKKETERYLNSLAENPKKFDYPTQ